MDAQIGPISYYKKERKTNFKIAVMREKSSLTP